MYIYINWFTWIIFLCDSIRYTKKWGNENSPNSINIMVNYRYQGENRVINIYACECIIHLPGFHISFLKPVIQNGTKKSGFKVLWYSCKQPGDTCIVYFYIAFLNIVRFVSNFNCLGFYHTSILFHCHIKS